MGVTFERVTGWLARIGPHHRKHGDPYTGTCVVTEDGMVKGLSGSLSPRLINEARKTAERELGLNLFWERIKPMAKYESKIVAEYRETGSNAVKARATLEYFDMDKPHVEALERGLFGGLLGLQSSAE